MTLCSNMRLKLALGENLTNFRMEEAVCNHGFFMMSPNVWNPYTKSLSRLLRLANGDDSTNVTISHLAPNLPYINIQVANYQHLSSADEEAILSQVARMLRISKKDERDAREFQKLHAHASSKNKRFGRIFRSPSIFEDIIKSILLCNCAWGRTLEMARALCQLQAKLNSKKKGKKRKRSKVEAETKIGNFPSARELAGVDVDFLEKECKLGYRAKRVISIAKDVVNGRLKLEEFEQATCHEKVYKELMSINGLGPFICSNVLMCIGFYQKVPSDTETIRLLKKVHDRGESCLATIEQDVKQVYGKYAPYQCLAYWMELLDDYESQFGKLSKLKSCMYHTVTSSRAKT